MNAQEERDQLRMVASLAGLGDLEIVLPEEHEIVANHMRFHYLEWGSADKPPMLLLHGGGLNAHTWDVVCLGLRRDYHCIAVDARGHGDSEWSAIGDYRREAHRADVEALVGQLGLNNFVLVGMSMGGMTALDYAGRHAEKLSALVLVDVGPETHRAGANRIRDFSAETAGTLEEYVERAAAFNPLRSRDVLRRSLQYNLRRTVDGKLVWKHDPNRHGEESAEAQDARRAELWNAVARITCPTLVVRGGKSDVFFDEDAQKLANALPRGSWVRVEGAGHTVQGDQPKALLDELRRFLRLPAAA